MDQSFFIAPWRTDALRGFFFSGGARDGVALGKTGDRGQAVVARCQSGERSVR